MKFKSNQFFPHYIDTTIFYNRSYFFNYLYSHTSRGLHSTGLEWTCIPILIKKFVDDNHLILPTRRFKKYNEFHAILVNINTMKIIKTFNFKNKVDYYDLPPERVSRSRVTKRYQLNLLKRCLKAKKNADYLVLFLDFYIVKPLKKQFNWNLFRQNNIMIRSAVFFNGGGSINLQKQLDNNLLLFSKIYTPKMVSIENQLFNFLNQIDQRRIHCHCQDPIFLEIMKFYDQMALEFEINFVNKLSK